VNRRVVLAVARLCARMSPRLANVWLVLCHMNLRYYSSIKVLVGGVELREVKEIDFPKRRRR
jgi:hypothetical protein